MKIKHFALTTGMAIGATIASGSTIPASAFTIFFGEDINANAGANPLTNSNIAATSFSNLISSTPQGFDSISPGVYPVLNIPGATITSANSFLSGVSNTIPPGGRFPISGSNYYEVGSTNANGALTTTTITFNEPIAAFGFYATDIENKEGITLQLNNVANTLLTLTRTTDNTNDGTSGSALFYGLIAQNPGETFTSVTLSLAPVDLSKQNDRFGIDNLTFQTAQVPEPFTIIGTIVGGTAAFRMRKKLKSTSKD